MTPDFWTGVLTGFIGAFVLSFFAGVALVHLCGLRETGDDRSHGATINGREACHGCGVPLTEGAAVLHHSQCPAIGPTRTDIIRLDERRRGTIQTPERGRGA